MNSPKLRLGVNIDHVATVRNARGGSYPDPLRAARLAEQAGADGITAHLREDRRHISDHDITALINNINLPLNLEMAATSEMLSIALKHKPHAVCIVPEQRQERTTESGLEVAGQLKKLREFIKPLKQAGCRVSLFVNADSEQIDAASIADADVIELHTGRYCDLHIQGFGDECLQELQRIRNAATRAQKMGLEVHAGHGLTYDSVLPIAEITEIIELNIGHFLIGESIFLGLDQAIRKMQDLMDRSR